MKVWLSAILFTLCICSLSGCGEPEVEEESSSEDSSEDITLESIEVTIDDSEIEVDDETQLTVTAVYSDDSEEDVTDEVDWDIDDSDIVSVDSDGVVTGLEEGSTEITATYETESDSVDIEVVDESDSSSDDIELSLAIQPTKTFSFSWESISDVDHYVLTENPDGASGYSDVDDDISSSDEEYELEVPLFDRGNASYILTACYDDDCDSSIDSDAISVDEDDLEQGVGYFKASTPGSGDRFGFALALSGDGNTMAVSAPKEDSDATGIDGDEESDDTSSSGAVYIFVKEDDDDDVGEWSQQAYIKASNTGKNDTFGGGREFLSSTDIPESPHSIALSEDGDVLVVGAYSEDSDATGINGDEDNDDASGSGAVYVFERDSGMWEQVAYIKASNAESYDFFGCSVALSGDGSTIAVGACQEDSGETGVDADDSDNTASSAGAVYVFVNDNDDWEQEAYLKASNTGEGDYFGSRVSLSEDGDVLAVSAPLESSDSTGVDGEESSDEESAAGAVYVFKRDSGDWSQDAYLKASNTESEDYFGYALTVSADGSTLAVGAIGEDSASSGIDGTESSNTASESGAVYLFVDDDGWEQQAYVKASNSEENDYFGNALSLSEDGDVLAVSSFGEASKATGINGSDSSTSLTDAGAVYTFKRSGSSWKQVAYIKSPNTDEADYFGVSISLDYDAETLAVGANEEDGDASGINGDFSDELTNSGAVYLY